MDAELQDLMAAFGALQNEEAQVRLSEGNCVELMGKLVRAGLLPQLLYTRDGSEYVTQERLEQEIVEAAERAGRLEVVKLPSLLNLDLEHIEAAVGRLLAAKRGNMRLIEGELVTESFLDRVCLEVGEMLQLQHELSVTQLAARFQFSSDFVEHQLLGRALGKSIVGVFDDGVVYTDLFVRRQQARLCGLFESVTVPTLLAKLLPVSGMKKKMFFSLLDDLLGKGALRGSLTGKRGSSNETYVPHVHHCLAQRYVTSFYTANGCVPFERVSAALGSEAGLAWLTAVFPRGVSLKTCFVEPGVLEQLDAHLEEALAEGMMWVDVEPLVPAAFTEEDTMQALALCKNMAGLQTIAQRFAVSPKLAGEAQTRLKPLVEEAVASYAKKLAAVSAAAAQQEQQEPPRRDQEENEKETKGKKKQRPQSKKTLLSSAAKPVTPRDCLTMDMCRRHLASALRKCPPDLVELLCAKAFPTLLQEVEEACVKVAASAATAAADVSGGGGGLKELLEQTAADFVMHWLNYSVFAAALAPFEGDSLQLMSRHLIRTTGVQLAATCLRYELLKTGKTVPPVDLALEKERVEVLKLLPPNASGPFVHLHKLLTGEGTLAVFEKALQACASCCGLATKSLDAKTRRGLVQAHRQGFLQQLEDVKDPALAVHVCVVTLYAFRAEGALNIPSRCLNVVVNQLAPMLDADTLGVLRSAVELEDKGSVDVAALKKATLSHLKPSKNMKSEK